MSKTKERKRWLSGRPSFCDLCRTPIKKGGTFIDGKTDMGPWGILCVKCHRTRGFGLGIGRGQKYSGEEMLNVNGEYF